MTEEKSINLFELPVHPHAAIFPMLDEDELQELADDIAENGLQQPIVIGEYNGKLHLIDGRNRLAGCGLAKVEPTYRMLNGEDPTAFILSANINRRHMTKGAQAMARAMLYPEAKVGRPKKGLAAKPSDVNKGLISQARTVLRVWPDKADKVLSGGLLLGKAYDDVQKHLLANRGDDERMKALRIEAPLLADDVAAARKSLDQAEAELRSAEQLAKEKRTLLIDSISRVFTVEAVFSSAETRSQVVSLLKEHRSQFEGESRRTVEETVGRLSRLRNVIDEFLEEIAK